MTATAPLHALAEALDGDLQASSVLVGDDVISCSPTGVVRVARHAAIPTQVLRIGTLSDGAEVLAAAYRSLVAGVTP